MSSTSPRFLQLPTSSSLCLRDQICEMISIAIASGSFAYDSPLPSCRDLAKQLGVSRNTAFAAYSRLVDLDFLVSRDRSGYFVNPQITATQMTKKVAMQEGDRTPCPLSFTTSELMPIVNPLDWQTYPYPFIYNQVDLDLFPVDGWRECARKAMGRANMPIWVNDSVESDSQLLLKQLRQRLLNSRGIYAKSDEILITLGAQNALLIIGMVFNRYGKTVALEDPGFFGARNAFLLAGYKLSGVPIDKYGLIPSAIPQECQLVFVTPSHQFPTMITMSQKRRIELLKVANEKDFLIIEDDYEAEMNHDSISSPSICSMDRNGRVIYVGSLSKTLSPGIRMGFIVAHRDIIRQARIVRGVMLRHPPTLLQEIVALFFQLGHYDSHLRNIERRYKKRWHAMDNAINKHLNKLQCTKSKGGSSFWLTAPKGFNASDLKDRLQSKGVLIDRGQDYHLDTNNKRSFRLGFACMPASKIDDGVRIIAQEIQSMD